MSENKDTGPQAGVKGVVGRRQGQGQRSGGGHHREGRIRAAKECAQQDKAAAERDVAVKEAEAEKARAEADVHEAEQRSHQS